MTTTFKTYCFLILFGLGNFAFGQSNEEIAYTKGMEAIKLMEKGQVANSIKLLEEAKKLDPKNINYPYEIAYAHCLDKNYKKAIKILEELKKRPDAIDRVHQLLGNSYSFNGEREKAIAAYDKGLKDFPKSGILHLERGNMELFVKNYDQALYYYEKGIKVDPKFPSNYYWCSKLFCNSTEEVWGMIYGEIFMNLERNSKRTAEISKLLYDVYNSEIKFQGDTSFSVSFSQNATISISDLSNLNNLKLPFGIGAYEPTLMMALIGEKSTDIHALNRVRQKFVELYHAGDTYEKYPNILFDYQRQLLEAGHLEAYSYWILMKGNEDEVITWKNNNSDAWDNFIEWFFENPIEIDRDRFFHRDNY